MLLREVHHRVKNLLALVQALARQTEARGEAAEAYRDAFLGRLGSLVQAHGLAFEASAPADLGELIGRVLAPYAADPATITIEAGPRVALARGQVTPVCLILHELATNAAKHGALSSPAGRVRVAWRDDGDAAGGTAVAVSGCAGRSRAVRKSGRRRARASAPGWSSSPPRTSCTAGRN